MSIRKKLTFALVMAFQLLSFSTFSENADRTSPPQKKQTSETSKKNAYDLIFVQNQLDRTYLAEEGIRGLELQIVESQLKVKSVIEENKKLNEQLTQAMLKINQLDKNTDWANYSAILLTAVAVLVTVLGVIIAVITFIGYKNIIEKAENKAIEYTTSLINQTANDEITSLIENGAFEKHITDAVDRVVYKDIFGDEELTNDKSTEIDSYLEGS